MIEPELIHRAQRGDGAAVGELLQYSLPEVRRVVTRVLGTDAEAVDDVVQLALLKIWRKLDLYQDGNFDGWIKRIAQFTAYDYRRDGRPGRLISYDLLEFMMAGDGDPVQSILTDADYAAILAAIDEIDEMYQPVVRLLYVERMSMLEAAAELNLNLGTLKSRSFRGRQMLKDLLRTKGIFAKP